MPVERVDGRVGGSAGATAGRDAGMKEVPWDQVMVDVIMGYECNVKCDYCSVSDRMRPHNMTTRQVLARLEDARARGVHRVSFGGGEPTIRKDLVPLVRWCRDRGFDWIKVSSNGLMYQYEDYARSIVEAGVTDPHVSAMAHTDELYESIMGLPGALGMVRKGVENLVGLGLPPALDLIIKNDTYEHLADIIEYWAAVGVREFILWLVSLTDRNKDNLESLPRVSVMAPHIERAFDRAAELGVFCESRHIPRCMLKGHESFVRDLRQDLVTVVTPGSTFNLWESVISANTYTEKCKRCRYYQGECMGARNDYLQRWGDDELDPYPPEGGDSNGG